MEQRENINKIQEKSTNRLMRSKKYRSPVYSTQEFKLFLHGPILLLYFKVSIKLLKKAYNRDPRAKFFHTRDHVMECNPLLSEKYQTRVQ